MELYFLWSPRWPVPYPETTVKKYVCVGLRLGWGRQRQIAYLRYGQENPETRHEANVYPWENLTHRLAFRRNI